VRLGFLPLGRRFLARGSLRPVFRYDQAARRDDQTRPLIDPEGVALVPASLASPLRAR